MDPRQKKTIMAFSVTEVNIERLTKNPDYDFRRDYEEEFHRLPTGSRMTFLVGKCKPTKHFVDWLPKHLIYCITGPDWRNNAEWVRLIEGGEE